MSKISKALAALALVVAVNAYANNSNEQFAEGVTGVAFKAVKLSPASDWSVINRKALPDWPTIQFPDGVHYRVDSLCTDGTNLYNRYAKTATVCQSWGEGHCYQSETIALVQPINYVVKGCAEYKETVIAGNGGEDHMPYSIFTCVKPSEARLTHALSYVVDVKTAPRKLIAPDMVDINSGELLFKKNFTIPSCK